MATIDSLIERSMLKAAGLRRGKQLWFGGSKTSMRRSKCLAYAWRQHRRSGNPAPFWFRVTGSVFRDPRQGRDRDGRGVARPTVGRGRVIGFVTDADRKRAVPFLRQLGYDYFLEFRDVSATYAMQIGVTKQALIRDGVTPQSLKPGVLFSNRVR